MTIKKKYLNFVVTMNLIKVNQRYKSQESRAVYKYIYIYIGRIRSNIQEVDREGPVMHQNV